MMDEILKLFGGAENIWNAIKESAAKAGIESTRMMLELFYVLKSPGTGLLDKTLIVTALGYQLLPNDVLPREKYGLLGFLDNVVTIGFAYNKVKSSVTPEIENQVNNILLQWFGVGNELKEDLQGSLEKLVYKPMQQENSIQQPLTNNNQKPVWSDDEDVVVD